MPEVVDHEESDTAGVVEYTLSNGGMLEEPSAGDDQSAYPSKVFSLMAEDDKVEEPAA